LSRNTLEIFAKIVDHWVMSNNLIQLSTGDTIDLSSIDDGLVVIFSGNLGSQLMQDQMTRYEQNQNLFDDLKCSLLFVTDKSQNAYMDNVILDEENVCNQLSPELAAMGQPCDSILFLEKTGDHIEHVYTRLRPNPKYNWIEEVIGFCRNYFDKTAEDGKWKFGQKVTQEGEYLCTNCGYIIELEKDQIFPVCEVCLSGDPRGACSVKVAFWQKLD